MVSRRMCLELWSSCPVVVLTRLAASSDMPVQQTIGILPNMMMLVITPKKTWLASSSSSHLQRHHHDYQN